MALAIRTAFRLCSFPIVLLCAVGACASAQPVPATTATYFSDAAPVFTINNGEIVLRKELTAFGNYGAADGLADILYTGQAATWHFALPPGLTPDQVQSAYIRASLVADDHGAGISPYRLAAWVDDNFLGNGIANLPYGMPFSKPFINWVTRDYPVITPALGHTLTLQNTSLAASGDWIAVDWIELHLTVAQGTEYPSHAGNAGPTSITIVQPGNLGSAVVKLTGVGQDIVSRAVTVPGPGALSATFDLTGVTPGLRSIVISSAGGTITLQGALTIEQDRSPDLWIGNYQLVDSQPRTGSLNYLTFRAYLNNPGAALSSVTATVTSLDPFAIRVLPGQDTVTFQRVPAQSQVVSSNTFTILADSTVPFDSTKLQWTFQTPVAGLAANPGPSRTVKVGSTVILDGSASSGPGGPGALAYDWAFTSRPPGTSTRLFYTSTVMPTFVADVAGVYVIALTVSNGLASDTATVTITSVE